MTTTSLINGSYVAGVNLAWNAYGADFGTGGWGYLADWNSVTSEFSTFESEGVNTVRWWVFGDGRYSPVFNPNGTTAGLNSGFLADIDHALQIASQDHVKLLLTLIDNTMFNFASDGGNGVQLGGHANIVNNATDRQSFMDNALKPLLQHIAASPYKDAVLGYDIINEPEAQIAGGYNGSDFFRGPAQLALSDVQSFVAQAASYIHTYDPGALATVGSAMPIWAPLWQGLGLDFYEVHYYQWMDFNGPGTGLPPASSITSDTGVPLDKPVVVGEFPTADVSYGLTDTAVDSAEWYLNYIQSQGYAGALGWSLTAGDNASNWTAFAPVFSNWVGSTPPPPPPPPVDPDVGPEPPVLTVSSPTLTLPAHGSVPLPITVAAADSDDTVTVKISGLTKYESVTDNLDGSTFNPRRGSVTLTAEEVNSGLTLNSTYGGRSHPVNTLTVTASNSTAGETGTAAAQTIRVTDPPATTDPIAQTAALLIQTAAGFQNGNNAGLIGAPPSRDPPAGDTSFLTKPHS